MSSPIRRRFPRRQAFLFLTATLVPCLVLLALGLRLIAQERQLEDKRRTEQQQLVVAQVRQEILTVLEKIKFQQMSEAMGRRRTEDRGPFALSEIVALVGVLVDGRLQLPWESDSRAKRFKELMNERSFARSIRQAEVEEFETHDYAAAVHHYQAAVAAGQQPAQQGFARLLKARALRKLGRRGESMAEYEAVMASPTDLVDEHGIPLALYAAPPLLEGRFRAEDVLSRIRVAIDGERKLSPMALYLARDLVRTLDAPDVDARLWALLQDVGQAEALQRDSARLLTIANSGDPVWMVYGTSPWLVSVTRQSDALAPLVIAVRAAAVLSEVRLTTGPIHFATAAETFGETLGETFPGVRLIIPTHDIRTGTPRQAFLALALMLALMFTLLAGYLLWRDVQRDLRLVDLRSQFVSSVTHELKTPLTAIRMFTETLRLDEEVDHRTRSEYLETILYESERLSRLVDNVLDFGKIERGTKIYRFERVRLENVVEGAARAMQHPLEQAGFALEVDVDRDLPTVTADSDALRQAIVNLLTNAMKYSGDSRRIRLGLNRKNGDARIVVMDEGVGIAAENHERIFENFYRAPNVENRHVPGAGLGLTLVAHIASAHGGDVHVDSSPGTGSIFTIRLPLAGGETNPGVSVQA